MNRTSFDSMELIIVTPDMKTQHETIMTIRAAAKWYRLAAAQGSLEAQRELGRRNKVGIGIPINPVRAFMWYSLAADNGDGVSQAERDRRATFRTPLHR